MLARYDARVCARATEAFDASYVSRVMSRRSRSCAHTFCNIQRVVLIFRWVYAGSTRKEW